MCAENDWSISVSNDSCHYKSSSSDMRILCLVFWFLAFGSAVTWSSTQNAFVELDLVNVSVLTKFTCFSTSKFDMRKKWKWNFILNVFQVCELFFIFLNQVQNAYITAQLSNESFQLRHITRFDGILRLIDTPRHTTQGFIVNIACDNFRHIFNQVCVLCLQ